MSGRSLELESGAAAGVGELPVPVAIHWSPKSPFVRKVMFVLFECGLAERVERIRTVVDRLNPNRDYMTRNPLGTIPALALADGRLLFDSPLICDYLLTLVPRPHLMPSGTARFAVLERQAFADGMTDALLFWRQERLRPAERQSEQIHRAYALKAATALDRLERDAPDFHDAPDLGHVAIGCALAYLDLRFPDLDWRRGRDALAQWHGRFEALPSARVTRLALDA